MKALDDKPLHTAIEWLAQRVYDTRDRVPRNDDYDYTWHRLDIYAEGLSELAGLLLLHKNQDEGAKPRAESPGVPSGVHVPQAVLEESRPEPLA